MVIAKVLSNDITRYSSPHPLETIGEYREGGKDARAGLFFLNCSEGTVQSHMRTYGESERVQFLRIHRGARPSPSRGFV